MSVSFNTLQKFDIVTILCSSLAFIVSLQWNNLFQNIINYYYPDNNSNAVLIQSLHTILLTVLICIAIYYITKYENIIMKLLPHPKK